MPIRTSTFHVYAFSVMLACAAQVQADGAAWNGSYAADGSCYCVGEQSRNIDSQIIPTPVGGQSVAQICERVGNGPMLQKINGKYNFTVYPDAQCGNGPFPDTTINQNKECIGHLGVSGEDCVTNGPRWDLTDAYSRPAKEKVKGSLVTGGSRYIEPPSRKVSAADSENLLSSNTSVAEIARVRADSDKISRQTQEIVEPETRQRNPRRAQKVVESETREQIRARQLLQLAEARDRAKLAKSAQLNSASEPDKGALPDAASVVMKPEKINPSQPEASKNASVGSVAKATKTPGVTKETPTAVTALKIPAQLSYSDPDFNYIEAVPVNYDFGGAGVSVVASKSSHHRMQYILNAAAANTYHEAAIGVGMFFTPGEADRTTMMVRAGLEYGSMNFQNSAVKTTHTDSGVFATLATRVAFTSQFELQAGIGYSSFFEGDVIGFGAAFYHINPKLDLTAKTEIGDNDLLGFGIRYHY